MPKNVSLALEHSRRFRYETKNELRNNLSGRDYEKGQHTRNWTNKVWPLSFNPLSQHTHTPGPHDYIYTTT